MTNACVYEFELFVEIFLCCVVFKIY